MGPTPDEEGPADRLDTVLVAAGGNTRLHIPHEGRPRCATGGDFRAKPLAVFPAAHRDWCRTCLRLWREHGDRLGEVAGR